MDFLGRLLVQIVGDNSQLDSSIQQSESRLRRFSQSATRIGQTLTTRLTLPITLAAGAAVRLAIQAEETNSAFRTSFRGIEDSADSAARNLQDNFGLSRLEAERLLQSTGDLLRGFGATQTEALDLSSRVQQLSVDLASFRNIQGGAERASEALTAALLGERDQLRSLGIVIREADVQQRLFENGQAELTGQARLLAVAQATLELATEQSGDAVGDFARTSTSSANQLRQLRSDITDAAVEIGENLLPAVNQILEVLRNVTSAFAGLSEQQQQLVITLGLVAAAAGPATLAIGSLGRSLTFIGANPVVAGVAVLLGAITFAVIQLGQAGREARGSLEDLADETGVAARELDEVARAISEAEQFDRTFEDVERSIRQIAEASGETVEQVARIGIESSRIDDNYREQLQLILDQEVARREQLEAEEALANATQQGVDLNANREQSLLNQEETLERQTEITARLNALLEEDRVARTDLLAIDELIRSGALTEEEGLRRKIALREDEIDRLREILLDNESLLLQGERSVELADRIRQRNEEALTAQLAAQQRYFDRLEVLQSEQRAGDDETARNAQEATLASTEDQIERYRAFGRDSRNIVQMVQQAQEEAAEAARQATINSIREQISAFRQLGSSIAGVLSALNAAESARFDNFRRRQEEIIEGLEEQSDAEVETVERRLETQNEADALTQEQETAAAQARIDRLNAEFEQDRARILANVADQALANAQIAALEQARAEQVNEIEAELEAANDARTQTRIEREEEATTAIGEIERQSADETDELRDELDRRQRNLQRAQARRQKAISLFNIAANTASAIVQALPNIPLSITVGALGAAQAAIVGSTPLPALAQGGFFSGPALIGEAGREFAFPLDGAQGQTAMALMADRIVDSMNRSGGTTNTNQNVTINSMFNLGTETQQRRAARALYPALENEARRRGQRLAV